MEKSLVESSSIIKLKSRFFIYRALTFFSFLLVPIWIQKLVELNAFFQSLVILCYLSFMFSQWYLLGKEIDHRFKIYFRANSSVDRILYRALMGSGMMMVVFNFLSMIPEDIINHFFWGVWVVLGLFYSWPTRGKIIEESMSTQFQEYKFLDGFERTILFLCITLLIISIPQFPSFGNLETLKLLFDPAEKIHNHFWNFLSFTFFPFKKYPNLLKIAYCLYFYAVGTVLFLLAFYALLRYFLSRRIAILGIFSVLSTWTFSKILEQNIAFALTSSFSVIWVWALLWCIKSATYRCGLFIGIVGYIGTLINIKFSFLLPVSLILLYGVLLPEKTRWYRRQIIKYAIYGMLMVLLLYITKSEFPLLFSGMSLKSLMNTIVKYIDQKAFYSLSLFGIIAIAIFQIFQLRKLNQELKINQLFNRELVIALITTLFLGMILEADFIYGFGLIWIISYLSLIPIEIIFRAATRLRSKRNMIFLIYILICLLDSHFEGRVKILVQLFKY